MVEYVLCEDTLNFRYVSSTLADPSCQLTSSMNSYDEMGNTRGVPRFNALKPIKLKWSIPESVSRLSLHLARCDSIPILVQ